jgi:AraC-like DNA-binding protein
MTEFAFSPGPKATWQPALNLLDLKVPGHGSIALGGSNKAIPRMNNASLPPNALVLRYEGPTRGPQYEAWREEICRGFAKADFDTSKSERVEFEARTSQFSNLSAISFRTGQESTNRNIVSFDCDDFILATAVCRNMSGTYAAKEVKMLPNEMGLIDVNSPATLHMKESGSMHGLRIPRANLLHVCPHAEDRLGQRLLNDPSLRSMISRYTALTIELAPNMDAVSQHLMAQHLVDLVGLLLGAGRERKELMRGRGYSAARLDIIRADLLENLGRANLKIGEIARQYGLSARQAQRLFEQSGQTFTEFVLENRLLLARAMLLDPRRPHGKISDVAHSAGFTDISYFNRVFRKRFGATPSEIRSAISC